MIRKHLIFFFKAVLDKKSSSFAIFRSFSAISLAFIFAAKHSLEKLETLLKVCEIHKN